MVKISDVLQTICTNSVTYINRTQKRWPCNAV